MHVSSKGLKDAARGGAARAAHAPSTCAAASSGHVCMCVSARDADRRAHTRRRGRDNRWLRGAAGESSDQLGLAFFVRLATSGFPRSFPVSHCFRAAHYGPAPAEAPTRSTSSSPSSRRRPPCRGMTCSTARRCGRTAT